MESNQFAKAAVEASQKNLNMNITPEMIRSSKTLTCECGGTLFHDGVFFKILSPLISPTGQEETRAFQALICENCGKIPSAFDPMNVAPENAKAKLNKDLLGQSGTGGKNIGITY